jgi:hypothetical protein
MFLLGSIKDQGVDITFQRNPGHVLSPDSLDIMLRYRFKKISTEDFRKYYLALLQERRRSREREIVDLAISGITRDIRLVSFEDKRDQSSYAMIACDLLNSLVTKMKLKA